MSGVRVRKAKEKRPKPPLPDILTGPNLDLLVPFWTERTATGSSGGTPVSAFSGNVVGREWTSVGFWRLREIFYRMDGAGGGGGGKVVRELMEVFVRLVVVCCGTEDSFADPQSPVGSERWRFGHGYYLGGTGNLASLASFSGLVEFWEIGHCGGGVLIDSVGI
ncbi:hypothetical protein HDV00_001254 [Rhizophlyctis rosea]|nr:hypothetical protein HDV00_001254 [Rhizophlyctis rosea]